MKKVRLISLGVLLLLLCALFINKDKILSFALEDSITDLVDGTIIKNNTTFKFEDFIETASGKTRCVSWSFFTKYGEPISDSGGYYCTTPDDLDGTVTFNNDASDYWFVSTYDNSGSYVISLFAFEYSEPEFKLECSPSKITMDSYATCTVSVDTYYAIDQIKFSLNLDDFVIYDEEKLEDVEEFNKEDNHYVLTPIYIDPSYDSSGGTDPYEPFDEPVNLKLMQFKIKTLKEQNVEVLDNVKLAELEYTDVLGESEYPVLTATVGQESNDVASNSNVDKPDDGASSKDNKNPDTVDAIITAVILCIISFATIIIIKIRDKKVS